MTLSYKFKMRLWSVLHPIRTLKALYFIRNIENTDEWKKLVETNPKKAFEMKWNRFYRRKFPWKNPRTLNEKLTWMEVYTDTSKWTEYTDKYEVRKHIESLGLKDILTECYGVWDRAEDINFDKLPDKFVLKCSHDCGSTIIIRDKSKMDKQSVIDFLNKHVSVRYGYDSCEPHYTSIKPRIMAESLIEMDNTDEFSSETTVDHKIRCIDGKVQYDMVCYDRSLESGSGGSKTIYDLYDIHTWQPMRQYLADKGVKYRNVPRPQNLERMIEIAEIIGKGYPQVRVDLYNVKGKIYFGEMTFFAFSGMNNHFTMEFQRMIGDRIQLPKIN
jgi:hypothetical protein